MEYLDIRDKNGHPIGVIKERSLVHADVTIFLSSKGPLETDNTFYLHHLLFCSIP